MIVRHCLLSFVPTLAFVRKAAVRLPGCWTALFCSTTIQEDLPHYTTDVAIVGTGFAGLAAAVEAGNAGSQVLLLEKQSSPGGNSIYNAGQVAAVGNTRQIQAGIEDRSSS